MHKGSEFLPFRTIGIDLGDRRSSFCVLERDGTISDEGSIPTQRESFERLGTRLGQARVIIEACGQVHWIHELLSSQGHEVIVANPRELSLISQSARKTDRNDARLLARLGRADPTILRPVRLRSMHCQADRALLRARESLVSARTALINFVRGEVKSFGARIPRCSSESFHRKANSFIPSVLHDALLPILDQLEALHLRIREFEQRIAGEAAERHPVTTLLRSAPGVGPIVSLAFAVTIEDPSRFQDVRTVGAYLGLTPKKRESGDRSPQLRISKRGDEGLRRLLVNAASYILGPFGKDNDLRRYGQRLAQSGSQRDRGRARIAVARKLAVILLSMWKTGELYRPLRADSAAAPEPHTR